MFRVTFGVVRQRTFIVNGRKRRAYLQPFIFMATCPYVNNFLKGWFKNKQKINKQKLINN